MSSYRIALADDHVLVRDGVKRIIQESEEMEVIGEADDGLALLALMKETTPDLVILDISMEGMRGIEATKEIKAIHPGVKVLILTMHKNKEYLYHSLSAGADGYLIKEDSGTELFSAIQAIQKGELYISPTLSNELTDDLIKILQTGGKASEDLLTTREREILKLIAEGKSNKEIANLLFISVRTVEHHRANLMEKLNTRNIVDLIKYAIRKGYTSHEI
ncbi:response regulator [Thermodesulfobacteriota bacterium]